MLKSLIGFVVLVIGMGIGYFKPVTSSPVKEVLTYPEIEPIEFVIPGNSIGSPNKGGSCG